MYCVSLPRRHSFATLHNLSSLRALGKKRIAYSFAVLCSPLWLMFVLAIIKFIKIFQSYVNPGETCPLNFRWASARQ